MKLDTNAKTITISDNGIGMTAEEVEKYIDYAMSEFVIQSIDGSELTIAIPTMSVLKLKSSELINSGLGVLVIKKIIFTAKIEPFDLFCLSINGNEFFVSKRLAEELEQRQLTGFHFEAASFIVEF